MIITATIVCEADEQPGSKKSMPLPPRVVRSMRDIQAKRLLVHVNKLCDPKLAGRQAGESGARQAADYVAGQFREIGLRPGGNAGSFFQTFKIRPRYQISSELKFSVGADAITTWRRGWDYMPSHLGGKSAAVTAECALVGYGISSTALKFDEYDGVNVKGKVVLVFAGGPWRNEATG